MEITFNYNGEELKTICNDTKQKIQDIFHNLKNEVDIKSILFLYSGKPIEGNLSVTKIVNKTDSQRNKMTILVSDKNDENEKPCWINSKDIICPKCGEAAKLDINEYKIILQCRNGHNRGNILLDEYENTQKVDISKIMCDVCKKTSKANSYNNIFYRCNQCRFNLCVGCQNKHQNENKDHTIINYEEKNYICETHNEKYSSHCFNCKKSICIFCEKEHEKYKGHKLTDYVKKLPNMKEAKINLEELKNKIDKFKGILDDLINRLNKVKNTFESYYNINKYLYGSVNNKHFNYEILSTINKINKPEIIDDMNHIINQKDNNEIFQEIDKLYHKITKNFVKK